MEDRIVVDFNALDRIARKLNTAGSDLDAAMSILSSARLTSAGGAYLRLNGAGLSLKSVGGSVSAGNVTQAVQNYRSALKRISEYSKALSSDIQEARIRFQQTENTMAGKESGIGILVDRMEITLPTTPFGSAGISYSLLSLIGGNWESSFINLKKTNELSLKSGDKFADFNKSIKDNLKNSGLREEPKNEWYKKNGKTIDKKDAPTFYDRQKTIAEIGDKYEASVSAYEGSADWGNWGNGSLTIGEAEAYAGWSAGLYVLGSDGKTKIFSPGAKVECGASVTALEASYKNQVFGDENLGVNVDATITMGKASAKAEGVAQVFNENGQLEVQVGASASAELIAAEVTGKAAVNVLGGEVGVKGSVNYGVGAHADVGYRDGVFKFDIGASLGVGVSIGAEIDVGGMINTVADAATSAWEGVQKGWSAFSSLF